MFLQAVPTALTLSAVQMYQLAWLQALLANSKNKEIMPISICNNVHIFLT
jgi:hypothetical protein